MNLVPFCVLAYWTVRTEIWPKYKIICLTEHYSVYLYSTTYLEYITLDAMSHVDFKFDIVKQKTIWNYALCILIH